METKLIMTIRAYVHTIIVYCVFLLLKLLVESSYKMSGDECISETTGKHC